MRLTTILLLCSQVILPPALRAQRYTQQPVNPKNYKQRTSNMSNSIVMFSKEKTHVHRGNIEAAATRDFTGVPSTIEDIRRAGFGFLQMNTLFYRDPYKYHPKCAQIIEQTLWTSQQCELPPACGISVQQTIADGWYRNEIACLSLFSNLLPNISTTFIVKHDHDWAYQFEIIMPNNYTNRLTKRAISNYVMFNYLDNTFQVLPKVIANNAASYSNFTQRLNVNHWTYMGKTICYHRPSDEYQLQYPRVSDPHIALYATGLILNEADFCNIGYTYSVANGRQCTVKYDASVVDIPCYLECMDVLFLKCEPDIDTFSPPGYIQRGFLAVAMWVWDLFSHSLLFVYTRLIKALLATWRNLNVYIYMAEYTLIFLVATMYFKNPYAGAAAVIFISTFIGFSRY